VPEAAFTEVARALGLSLPAVSKLTRELEEHGRARVADLAVRFAVSHVTIRKDLATLEQQRRLVRTHGGAVAVGREASLAAVRALLRRDPRWRGQRPVDAVLAPINGMYGIKDGEGNVNVYNTGALALPVVWLEPNADAGALEILQALDEAALPPGSVRSPHLARPLFAAALRHCDALVGNSSAGIIEAASFGTPVIDIGPRQLGRERSQNVTNVPYGKAPLLKALKSIWNEGSQSPVSDLPRNTLGSFNPASLTQSRD
jgi:GDP/UDP-N,N'-diacetylbacillosamine 2-epimerase (hydrolysing)